MCELNVTVEVNKAHAACLMLTHISSRIRKILVRAVCLMSVPLHNNV